LKSGRRERGEGRRESKAKIEKAALIRRVRE